MSDRATSVVVLGPGAIGGMLAALLWRADVKVTCVASEGTAGAIASDGIRLRSSSLGSFTARPAVATALAGRTDVLLVTTNAPALEEALERVTGDLGADAVVVPLLNGLEHMERLRRRFGRRVVAASIGQVEAKRVSATEVEHTTTTARIELASDGDVPRGKLLEVRRLLERAGVAAAVREAEAEVLWGKLVRLNALALTTAAHDLTLGQIRGDADLRAELVEAVREGAAVATAEGLPTDPAAVMNQIDALPDALGTSLQRDVNAGRDSELDAIAGGILRAAHRRGIACPTVERLMRRVEERAETPRVLRLTRN